MVNCAVPSCKNDSRRQTKQNSNITFHRFPKNEVLVKKWADALQRPDWEPTIRSFVCSAHFPETSMYFSKSGLRKLVQDAVPELSLDNFPQKHKKRKKKSKVIMPHMYVAEKDSVKKESSVKDSSPIKTLKKRIINLTKLSKRRRLRCNALYASLNRIRKRVSVMTGTLQELQRKVSKNSELSNMLEASGVSTAELFKGLWMKEKSCSPEPQEEEEDYFYSEIPNNIENYNQPQPLTIYTTSTSTITDLDVQVSVVKSEYSPRAEPEPVFINTEETCRGCQLSTTLMPLGEDLRELCERFGTRGSDMLCRDCVATLQRCRHLADTLADSRPRPPELKC